MRKRAVLAAFAVALVAALAHASSLGGGYTFDDHAIVEQNPRLVVHDLAGWRELLASNYWGKGGEASGERLFRPVPLVTYALERAIVGRPAPLLGHGVNVALHALGAVAALALFRRLASERAAILGALLFAAHPLHAEAVAGVVGRAEVLALLLALVSLSAHVRGGKITTAFLEGTALFLALGSKENAVATIPIAVVIDLALTGKVSPRRLVAPVVALAAYVAARALAIGSLVAESGARTLGGKSLLERLPYSLGVLRDAAVDTLLPLHGTSAHFPLPRTDGLGIAMAVVLELAIALFVGAALGRALLKRAPVPPHLRGVVVGAAGFELALLPVSNLIPIGVVYAERLLYAPTLWASLLVGSLLGRATRSAPGALAAALLVGGGVLLSSQNDRVWGDDLRLWVATVARFPEQPLSHLHLAEALLPRGFAARAVAPARFAATEFDVAQPLKAKANVVLAEALIAASPGNPSARDEAGRALDRALALNPRSVDAHLFRARLAVEAEDYRAAVSESSLACDSAPQSYEARWNLGFALWKSGAIDGALDTLALAETLDANPGQARFYEAEIRWSRGERAVAADLYIRAVAELVASGRIGEARVAIGPRFRELSVETQAAIVRLVGR